MSEEERERLVGVVGEHICEALLRPGMNAVDALEVLGAACGYVEGFIVRESGCSAELAKRSLDDGLKGARDVVAIGAIMGRGAAKAGVS